MPHRWADLVAVQHRFTETILILLPQMSLLLHSLLSFHSKLLLSPHLRPVQFGVDRLVPHRGLPAGRPDGVRLLPLRRLGGHRLLPAGRLPPHLLLLGRPGPLPQGRQTFLLLQTGRRERARRLQRQPRQERARVSGQTVVTPRTGLLRQTCGQRERTGLI